MTYIVEISPAAQRQINKLTELVLLQITEALTELKANPRPVGVVKMSGEDNLYRVR